MEDGAHGALGITQIRLESGRGRVVPDRGGRPVRRYFMCQLGRSLARQGVYMNLYAFDVGASYQ